MAIILSKDNFVWLDVTESMKYGNKKREELWLAHELYVLHDDDSDSLLESHDEIDEALSLGLRIVIEGGYLPTTYTTQPKWWWAAHKILKDGYWYVRWTDVKLKC